MAVTTEYLSGGRIQGASTDASGAVDTLGTAVNGTNSGCVTSSDTPFYGETSVTFDDNDAAHLFGSTSSFAGLVKEDFTVTFWAKTAGVGNLGWGQGANSGNSPYAGNQGCVLCLGQISGAGQGFVISFDDGTSQEFYVSLGDGTTHVMNDVIASTNAADTDNNYHLYMFHFDNTNAECRIYRDGSSTPVQTSAYGNDYTITSTSATTYDELYMGRQNIDDVRYFIGQLADVSIWKRLLTTSEFTQLWGTFADNTSTATSSVKGVRVDALSNQAGLLAHWKLDDLNFTNSAASTDKSKDSITNVPVGTRYEEVDTRKIFRRKDDGFTVGLGDSADMASDTGNTSVATITGQTDAPTFTTKGWSASSLQAYTETDALLIENDDWTISFWINSTSFTSMGGSKSPRLVNGRTSGDVNTSLIIEGTAGSNPPSTHILNAQIYKDPSGAVAANGSSGMVTNNWYNVVVTWTKSSGTVTFYVDYDGESSTGTVGSSTNMLLPDSGGYWLLGSTAEQFVGYITDYAFWNKVLTSSERQALYNSGAGVAANTIAKENLRVYYDCQSEPEVQKNGATPAAWVEKGTA